MIELCSVSNYIKIDDLRFHPNNPRMIEPDRLDALKNSIIAKGFYQPILIWKKGNIVLSGNHRLHAVRDLRDSGHHFNSPTGELDVLPVVVEDVSDETATAILFEANNNYAEWVDEKLAEALSDAKALGEDLTGFGFTADELDLLAKSAYKDALDIIDGGIEATGTELASVTLVEDDTPLNDGKVLCPRCGTEVLI